MSHQKRFSQKYHKAFTLIEVLLVMSLLSVIGIAVYNSFSNGIKIWQRGYRPLEEEDIALFLDRLKQDLQNTVHYSKISFDGTPDRISFAAIVSTPVDARINPARDQYVHQIGKVEYYWDKINSGLYRRQANYGQALKGNYGPERLLAHSLRSVTFHYYYWNGNVYYHESAVKGAVPSGISVDVYFSSQQNSREMHHLLQIPIGS